MNASRALLQALRNYLFFTYKTATEIGNVTMDSPQFGVALDLLDINFPRHATTNEEALEAFQKGLYALTFYGVIPQDYAEPIERVHIHRRNECHTDLTTQSDG